MGKKNIAQVVVGILCGCVVLLVLLVVVVLMVKWVVKTVQTYPYSNCTFHHQNSQRVQTSFTLPTNLGKALANITHLYLFLSACFKTGQDPCKNKHHCALFAGILCGCRVLLVLVVKWVKKPSNYVYALFSTRFNKEFKQVLPYQPTLGKPWPTYYLFLSACCEQNPCKNKHGETNHCTSCCRILCGCVVLLVLLVVVVLMVKWVVTTVQTYPYSNCTFHHQNSQRVQTSFTLPTNLGKALANIIHCTCFFQHVLKQDRIHARTNMGKIALCKLFAGILCGCRVLLVLVVKWVKKPSNYVYILTALFSTRFNKEFKQVLPYQPTSGKPWPT